jgi:hypothetical protein
VIRRREERTSSDHGRQAGEEEQAPAPITIRPAQPEDLPAVTRIAQRDSATVPVGELLLALEGAELRAAISIERAEVVADPFHPTAEVVELLSLRAAELRNGLAPRGNGGRLRGVGARAQRRGGDRAVPAGSEAR